MSRRQVTGPERLNGRLGRGLTGTDGGAATPRVYGGTAGCCRMRAAVHTRAAFVSESVRQLRAPFSNGSHRCLLVRRNVGAAHALILHRPRVASVLQLAVHALQRATRCRPRLLSIIDTSQTQCTPLTCAERTRSPAFLRLAPLPGQGPRAATMATCAASFTHTSGATAHCLGPALNTTSCT